jgi:hypothetical protein
MLNEYSSKQEAASTRFFGPGPARTRKKMKFLVRAGLVLDEPAAPKARSEIITTYKRELESEPDPTKKSSVRPGKK